MAEHLEACPAEESLWDRIQATHEHPLSVMLCLTERCPLSCRHCYLSPSCQRAELTTAEWASVMAELAQLGTLKLTFTGGEPALRPDLPALVAAATERRFATALKTSCYPFDTDLGVTALWEAGLSELNASLYHADPAEHDRFVGRPGAWERVRRSLSRFQKLGGIARVSIVAMGWNAAALPLLIDLCTAQRWHYAVDPRVIRREDRSDVPCVFRLDEPSLLQVLRDLRLSPAPLPARDMTDMICTAGRAGAYLAPNGEVWPCPNLPVSLGSIRRASFAEIWQSSPVRRQLLELSLGDSHKCAGCRLLDYCVRCPGDAYREHGELTQPSSQDCRLARVRANYAKLSY